MTEEQYGNKQPINKPVLCELGRGNGCSDATPEATSKAEKSGPTETKTLKRRGTANSLLPQHMRTEPGGAVGSAGRRPGPRCRAVRRGRGGAVSGAHTWSPSYMCSSSQVCRVFWNLQSSCFRAQLGRRGEARTGSSGTRQGPGVCGRPLLGWGWRRVSTGVGARGGECTPTLAGVLGQARTRGPEGPGPFPAPTAPWFYRAVLKRVA